MIGINSTRRLQPAEATPTTSTEPGLGAANSGNVASPSRIAPLALTTGQNLTLLLSMACAKTWATPPVAPTPPQPTPMAPGCVPISPADRRTTHFRDFCPLRPPHLAQPGRARRTGRRANFKRLKHRAKEAEMPVKKRNSKQSGRSQKGAVVSAPSPTRQAVTPGSPKQLPPNFRVHTTQLKAGIDGQTQRCELWAARVNPPHRDEPTGGDRRPVLDAGVVAVTVWP